MSDCDTQKFKVSKLYALLRGDSKEKLLVPEFQRGFCWKKSQQRDFIASLAKDFPAGCMLFYKKEEHGEINYILADGLQRCDTIKRYLDNKSGYYFSPENIPEELCEEISGIAETYPAIRSKLSAFMENKTDWDDNIDFFEVSSQIAAEASSTADVSRITKALNKYFNQSKKEAKIIETREIPVIIYSGPEEHLPVIFSQINSRGTPLSGYEIYSASWPRNKHMVMNQEIVRFVQDKYKAIWENGYGIYEAFKETAKDSLLTDFEYLFGLGKYLNGNYRLLETKTSKDAGSVSPVAFKLVNACINDTDKTATLYEDIDAIGDINLLENALKAAIEWTEDVLSPFLRFKGNRKDKSTKTRKSENQVISIIASVFREMYPGRQIDKVSPEWKKAEPSFRKNIKDYYVYDILTGYWDRSVDSKLVATVKDRRYSEPLSPGLLTGALDDFFNKSMERRESSMLKIAPPGKKELLILDCVHAITFNALSQIDCKRFEVEHIVPKNRLRKLIDACSDERQGLPISSIANLCYLLDTTNHEKQDKTIYEQGYTETKIADIERASTFTCEDDLTWTRTQYMPGDFPRLKADYEGFCQKRYKIIREKFCEFMGIDQDNAPIAYKGLSKDTAYEKPAQPFSVKNKRTMERNMNTDLDDFKEWVSTYVAKSTSGDYASAIRTCDRFAKERGLDVLPLETCRDYKQGTKTIWAIKSHPDFGAFNKSSHQRNNSALSYFERFLEENKP